MRQQAEGFCLRRVACAGLAAVGCLALASCAATNKVASKNSKYSPKVVADGEPVPKGGGSYRVGEPYWINGRRYVPTSNPNYRAEGIASWYGPDFHGRLTANGEVYDMDAISAAHTTMPMPSYARVTNIENGKSIIVRVNDRGPYARERVIDLSVGAAKALESYRAGTVRVRVEYVGPAPVEGSDDRMLMATLRHDRPAPAPSRVMVAAAKPFLPPAAATTTEVTSATRARPQGPAPVRSISAPDRGPSMATAQPVAPTVGSFLPSHTDNALSLMSGRGLY
jgi:rare lipoprotein A